MSNAKKTLIAGGLVSSAGILISKILSIVYVIPFSSLVGDGNMQYYSYAFDIFTYILNISTAGLPFAIASLVARHLTNDDYRTIMLIKRISLVLMSALGFLGMSFVFILAEPLALQVLPVGATAMDIQITTNVMRIISIALLIVPILACYRGFYQGFKEMQLYASNQVIEQIVRISFILIAGVIVVYVLDVDRIWVVYLAVFATTIAAISALAQLLKFDLNKSKEIKPLANKQASRLMSTKKILISLFRLALPFLIIAVLGEAFRIVDLFAFNKNMEVYGYSAFEAGYLFGILKFQIAKLTAIPMILASGFSIALIPYVSEQVAKRNFVKVRKTIMEIIETVMYLAIPMVVCLAVFAQPIYYVMYGSESLDIATSMLQWASLDALVGTIAPIISYLLVSLKLVKINLRNLTIGVILKLVLVIPMIQNFGYIGAILSTVIPIAIVLGLNLFSLQKKYQLNFKILFKRILKITIIMLISIIPAYVLILVLGPIPTANRIISVVILGCYGLLTIVTYFGLSYALGLPQRILHLDLTQIISKIKRMIKR